MDPGAAVIIGAELNGLGVCRSLGRHGLRSYLVDPNRLNPGMWSRFALPIVVPTLHGQELVDALLMLRSTMGRAPFLIVTDEMAVLTISALRERLDKMFLFRMPAHETVLMFHDKIRFQEFANSHNLPVPKGEIIRHTSDFGRLRALTFPLIIKPADKRHFHVGGAPRLIVAQHMKDATAACELLLEKAGEAIVHEWVGGADDTIYFSLFYRGRGNAMVSVFTGRKLASTPPGTGSTAYCTAAQEARDVLEPMTASIMDLVDYSGFGSVEYKWDAPTRRFVIIEPTVGRTDWQEEIATLSGVNIPLEAYRHEFELPPLPQTPSAKRIVWQVSYIERLKLGSVPVPPDAIIVDGYCRMHDPLPAIVHYPRDLLTAASHHLRGWMRRPD